MAVDSHADNHYELAIDNVNNNNSKQILHRSSIKLESRDDDFGLDPVNDDSPDLCSESQKGSARRKYSSVSKGISIQEFLLRQDRLGQLTAIDKLILKNKAALQKSQMKSTCNKPAPAAGTAATNGKVKKEPKPRSKDKVLASKVAAARKKVPVKKLATAPKKKMNVKIAADATSEAKTTKVAAKKKISNKKSVSAPRKKITVKIGAKAVSEARANKAVAAGKVEETAKIEGKSKRASESKKTPKKEAPVIATSPLFVAVKKSEPNAEAMRAIKGTSNEDARPIKVKSIAEEVPQPAKVRNTNVDGKPALKIGQRKRPIKIAPKKINQNERLLDVRGFKPNVSHKTRSSTELVKLRNGKSRIIADKKSPPSPPQRKVNRRSANSSLNTSSTSETMVNGNKSFKRSIKLEPMDDDAGVKSKRRKTIGKVDESIPEIAAEPTPVLEEAAIEPTPIPDQMPTLVKQDTQSTIPKPKPTIEETPIVPKEPPAPLENIPDVLKALGIVQRTTPKTEMIVDQAPIIVKDQLTVDPIIDEQSEPPMLSPQPPISSTPSIIDDVIVIDSSPEAPDIQEIETPPPVIPPSIPVPAKEPTPTTEVVPAKSDDQQEDTATETSDDTEGDEEFALQDANTESEDIIDEEITLHYETDDEDSTDKDIAPEPAAAAVATAVDPVQEPKEPVESAKEKIIPVPAVPVIEEPKVIPSQEKPKQPDTKVQERPENKAVKESILGALGLTSLEKVQQKVKENNNYTGTLKAVIKIDKGCRRMELKPKDAGSGIEGFQNENVLSFYSKTLPNKFDQVSDSASGVFDKGDSEVHPVNGLDSSSYKSKCDDGLLSSLREGNIRAMETDYNGIVDPVSGQLAKEKTKAAASLVVPEKSSSFSIHPNRLCSDVCKYCFGKFGSLDTPCHVGQMKNPERQRKILLCEPNLKLDTCLCDACYRFVDRKANKPPQKRNKNNMRRSMSITQRSMSPCVIQNCTQFARHTVKRKWLLRISKKIAKLSFDVNKGGPRMRYGLCSQHYYLVDFYTLCGICKKRLNRNHMYSIRSELNDLNNILQEDSIPIKLVDNMLLCKLCHYYMSLRLKYGNSSKMSPSNRQYYQNFRKKILIYYNVMVSDGEDTITSECLKYENGGMNSHSPESLSQSTKMIEALAASSSKPPTVTTTTTTSATSTESKRPSSGSSSSSKKNNHNVGLRDIADLLKPLEGDGDKNSSTRIQVKFGNLNIGKLSNLNIGQNSSTHQSEPKHDKSGDKDVPLIADFCFKTPTDGQKNWEKCVSTILFDKGTKKLWQDLQKPYGNQSSFIRHLIMLEKYWRSGALVLAGNADAGAVKYINSVKNRIQSLETSSSPSPSPSPSPAPPQVAVAKPPQVAVTKPPQVAVAKPPPMPTLKPATSSSVENGPSSVHYVQSGSSKTTPVDSATSNGTVRHTPAPPPLLKIDQMNGIPFNVSNKSVSSESKVQYQSHAPKPVTPRIADVSLEQYVEMMHPQPRTKQLTQVSNGSVKALGVSLLKKTLPSMPTMKPIHIANSSSAETLTSSSAPKIAKKSASMMYQGTANHNKPKDRPRYSVHNWNMPPLTAISTTAPKAVPNSSSMIIAKLPKALTVTQIDEPAKDKISHGEKPPHIAAPFLAGEKPSVSVFREITK